MWKQKQLLLAANKRSILATCHGDFVLRNSSNVTWRHLSSIVPNKMRDDHDTDGHANESFSNKQALQHLVQVSSMVAPPKLTSFPQPMGENAQTDEARKSPKELHNSPSELTYTGNATMPVTSDLHIVSPQEDTPRGTWPIFRIMVSLQKIGSYRQAT